MMIETLFFISLFGAAYSYFIYPVILLVLPRQKFPDFSTSHNDSLPFMSIIITAYNEESRIKDKLNNTLELEYPSEKLEILVASDGSTDRTNDYVDEYSSQGVKLINVVDRKGKENAQLAAIHSASGEIIVFSDVATEIPHDSLINLAKCFTNPKVGAVSSEDRFITEDGKIAGEGAYVKYEMWLRRLEADVKSLIGLSGSFFACRKLICNNWDINVPSDFNTALNCVKNGYIAISSPKVLGYYPNLKDESKEYQRKLRTVIRGIAGLFSKIEVMNPFVFGIFSFQVFSHKLMRWLVPWFMIACLIFNILLYQKHVYYQVILYLQFLFYALAVAGYTSSTLRNKSIIKLPYFFLQVNIAIAHAMLLFVQGKRITKWEPSKR